MASKCDCEEYCDIRDTAQPEERLDELDLERSEQYTFTTHVNITAIIKRMINLLKEEYHELHSPYTVLLESFIVGPELLTNECSICVPSRKLRL